MTGTQNHEGIVGAMAAVDYLADLGRHVAGQENINRRDALARAFQAIGQHEQQLVRELLFGLSEMAPIRVWGLTDPFKSTSEPPTVSITHAAYSPSELAEQLGERGLFVWHGNYYALGLTEALGLEPDGMTRIGLVHYNTSDDVQRVLDEIGALRDPSMAVGW